MRLQPGDYVLVFGHPLRIESFSRNGAKAICVAAYWEQPHAPAPQ